MVKNPIFRAQLNPTFIRITRINHLASRDRRERGYDTPFA